jgi:hypothetical protein
MERVMRFRRRTWLNIFYFIAGFEFKRAIDQPILVMRRPVGGNNDLRAKFPIVTFQIFPGLFGFQNMRVSVDP